MDAARAQELRELLAASRVEAVEHAEALRRDFDGLVDASQASNADDEHDPEGATIAFERAQVSALLAQARARIGDLDRALEQVESGTYGVCERCGGPIATERLAVRPGAATCIGCARR